MGHGALHIALDAYDQYADLAETFAFEERHATKWGGNVGLLVREPVGVVGAIVPWNAPPVLIAYKRSEERRVGKEGVSTFSSRWSPHPKNKKPRSTKNNT